MAGKIDLKQLSANGATSNQLMAFDATAVKWVPASHEGLLQLIHFIDEGPTNGFASGATKTTTGTVFPSQNLWKRADATKLVEQNITYGGALPTTVQWKIYAADGITVLQTVTDTIVYSGPFEASRSRVIA